MTVAPGLEPRRAALSVDVHGLRLDVRADDRPLLDALAARLAAFPRAASGAAQLEFAVDVGPRAARHSVLPAVRGSRVVYESSAGCARYAEDQDVLSITHGDVRLACDIAAGRVAVSVRSDAPPSPWLLSRPLFSLPLLELLKRRGRFGLHAAGLERDGVAVLAAGPAGSGKSTLALLLGRAGFGLLGDDLVFLAADGGRLQVLPFADEIELGDEAVALFPDVAERIEPGARSGWPKHRLAPQALGVAVGSGSPPAVLLLPTRTSEASSRVRPLSRDEALLELLPNVILTDRPSCEAHVDALAELVREAACYRLESGRDLAGLVALVEDVVGR